MTLRAIWLYCVAQCLYLRLAPVVLDWKMLCYVNVNETIKDGLAEGNQYYL